MSGNKFAETNNTKRCVGILGGAFDPVHIGHTQLAMEAYKKCHLNEVWFIPDQFPPWKTQTRWSIDQRLDFLEKVLSDFNNFKIYQAAPSEKNGFNYSVHTILEIRNKFPNIDFFWILGSDAFLKICSWHRTDEFQKNCRLIVIQRNAIDFNPDDLPIEMQSFSARQVSLEKLSSAALGSWSYIPADIANVSSTLIRKRLDNHQDIRDLVSEHIAQKLI